MENYFRTKHFPLCNFLQQHKCSFKKKEIVTETYVKGCQDIQSGSESDLMQAVASQGPISVAIDAGHPSFQSYSGGKFSHITYDKVGRSNQINLHHGIKDLIL